MCGLPEYIRHSSTATGGVRTLSLSQRRFRPLLPDDIEPSILARLQPHVRRSPDQLAVITRSQTRTDETLNHVANCLPHTLHAQCGAGY